MMATLVLGVFSDTEDATRAINTLETQGYNPKDMSFMIKDRSQAREFEEGTGASDVVGGTVGGVVGGAILGGLAGLVASFVIPGLGAFFIGGPLATALGLTGAAATTASGAATGAVAGGLIGALTSAFGLSDDEAKIYEHRINEGGILVAVPAKGGDEAQVESILNDFNADNIKMVHTTETTTSMRRESDTGYQPAYFSDIRKTEGKGWHGESKRHSRVKKRGTTHKG